MAILGDSGFVARSSHTISTHRPYAEAPTILVIGVPNLSPHGAPSQAQELSATAKILRCACATDGDGDRW